MSNHTVVLATFNDEASADAAAASLKESGVAKGDAIGVLVLDEKGKLKADKVGKRSWGKGAGIGAVVALVTPVGLAAGLIGGGLLGALHHKNLGLNESDPCGSAASWKEAKPLSAYWLPSPKRQ